MLPIARNVRAMATRRRAGPWPAAAALMLLALPLGRAQEIPHRLTVMDEFQIQTPTDPQISPDGKRIVYVRRFADAATDKR